MRAISPSAEMTSTYAVKYKYLIFAAEAALNGNQNQHRCYQK